MPLFQWRLVVIVLAALALPGVLAAQNPDPQPADVRVLVFEDGRPVPDLLVEMGGESGRTDADGTWEARLGPGRTRLTVSEHALALASLPVRLEPGEVAQFIITLTGPDRRAMVNIESSHADGREPIRRQAATPSEAQGTGMLTGRVVSTEDGAPISDARVFVSGTPVEARTDEAGRFSAEVPVGEYSVSVLHSAYATRTVDDVRIAADSETQRDFELPPAGLELAEYVVVEPYIEGSLTSVVATRRESAAVTDVLSAEQISRSGDSDAAGALKRVTGLTLVDGQYIYVRGLGERYSSVLLNGAAIPSPDPTRRVVPLDLFPTDVIQDVIVQKTATASMPGQFGGGTVQLRTLGFPEEFVAKISASGGYNSEATGASGLRYEGGGRDWTGRDDGSRAMPEILSEATADGQFLRPRSLSNPDGLTTDEIEEIGEALAGATDYSTFREDVRPDAGLSGALGNSFAVTDWLQVGALGAFRYSNSWDYREEEQFDFRASDAGLQLSNFFDVERTVNNIDFSGFLNLSARLGENHEIGMTRMLLRQTSDETRLQEGVSDSQRLQRYRLRWIENALDSMQFTGHHEPFGIDGFTLDWQWTDATARRDEPNTKRYRRDDDDEDGNYIFSRRADSNSQTFGDLDDNLQTYGFDLTVPLAGFTVIDGSLLLGYSDLDRAREASIRTFSFGGRFPSDQADVPQDEIFVPDNIGPDILQLQESTQPTDNYTASQTLTARYAALDFQPFDWLRINAGLRWEDNFQEVITSDLSNPQAPPVVSNIDERDELKSAAATWQYSDSAQLRAAYAETLSRPDFRELSPAPFLDPVLDLITVGNPDLRVTKIDNYDLRWEHYFNSTDSVSLAYFYKEFTDPIEKTFSSGGSARIITLQNALGADVNGWELDIYRQLGWIDDATWLDHPYLDWIKFLDWAQYYVAFNYASIESTVSLDETQTTQTNVNRPLEGQSPYVINFQVGYNSPDGDHEWTLLFNQFGERIVQAGVQRQPDIYEQPFPQLDFVYKQDFGEHWSFSAKLTNILDPNVEYTQGGETTRIFRKGRGVSLGLGVSF
jgi:outer membrane receptor protein involved in Fe transport